MGIKDMLSGYARTLKLAKKPTKEEFLQALKVTLAGIGVLGLFVFTIKLLSALVQLYRGG